ncbi:MAG: prepilin-type N-terminal cleavage/methylation domain-containing protein [Terricaulis sp.]|nr:prepilin-type N-terminal cleavage/methylation domain-containing protein [Terricaulis sp.]
MTARPANEAGFTLVEALVSLLVFSLIASGCVAMLMQSVESQRRVSAAHETLRELQTTRALLASDLAQMVLREVRGQDGARLPRFIGGDGAAPLQFVRARAEPGEAYARATALSLVSYRITEDAIIRASRADPDGGGEMSERVMLSDVRNGRFEFFDGTVWREAWLVGPEGGARRARWRLCLKARVMAKCGLRRLWSSGCDKACGRQPG